MITVELFEVGHANEMIVRVAGFSNRAEAVVRCRRPHRDASVQRILQVYGALMVALHDLVNDGTARGVIAWREFGAEGATSLAAQWHRRYPKLPPPADREAVTRVLGRSSP